MDNKIAMDLLNMIEFENAECNLGTWYHGIDDDMKEALEMALKALSSTENTNRCEDAISRSDAIRVASGYCHWSNIPKELAKLPSVNPIPCEDTISRQAVDKLIDELARAISDERCFIPRGRSTATIMQDILDLPSVSTEKTGHWIEDENEMKVWCSECGEENDECSKYCPNCGAKMQEVEE